MALDIVATTSNLDEYAGAQKVLLDIHNGIKHKYNCKVLGFIPYEKVHPKYNIPASEYVKFGNPFYLNNKILLVHARNVMAVIMVIKRIFFLNTRIIYIAHNVYDTHKNISFFPYNIVSISKKVTENLLGYFGLKNRNITVIYNGIKDEAAGKPQISFKQNGKIRILYSARVIDVKRQLLIVDQLNGKLHADIEIHFAGHGPDLALLYEKCRDSVNFKALGFVDGVNELVKQADFLMLYSIQEGLPISLIEGTMYGKPLLINDVGGNLEIGVPGVNGIELKKDWNIFADQLNSLVHLTTEEYTKMSVNSRARYETMFTYDAMVNSYTRLIDSLQPQPSATYYNSTDKQITNAYTAE
ncbi:glycosyltransferase family 4 protein [Mucilaginibacter rubeus]|uniref:Glycosyltransferase family 4 protein n=1 Tax=Mucilaginibacter rubeus TaxID=2027860 RepID=A0AAE6MGT9_9SPHI|nr:MULTISPECIES: glycosyltransferase family 4 protein [Mucilaginibacter]QEM02512.1 glycosyltransferase family 4 protein [Mucilaginibacter rubeus]QEM15132.1 glycosyltransferase family 4 protein [Mucilaginibacter gossypii]QTE42145.1 glycosyltransferase family 4 protein [Mucilaginibacter rubeus]QTE48746.1 glycosyltransferase family 4 protein [Mucilaginibacter rubeus]QTE53844.1 glycosyltransferase family 4 protein [Mucilaginibacter rubeus]